MRLLLVSPSFFGYESAIADEFRARGWTVDLVDERPSNRAWARAAVRVAPSMLRTSIEAHYRAQTPLLDSYHYDGLLVIKGEIVPPWFVDEFRRRNPAAVLAYYTFDALSNSPQGMRIVDRFSHRFSFDRSDVAAHPDFRYKPLFYPSEYEADQTARDIDISFVGTLHGERYQFAKAVAASIPEDRRELFFYSQAPWYFWFKRLTSREVRPARRAEVSFSPLSRAAVVRLAQRSRAVLDLQRSGQSGLTMRTFETLAAGAGLITANASIRQEPFFDASRILVVPRDPAEIDSDVVREFVAQVPVGTTPEGFSDYSIGGWVAEFDALFRASAA